MVHLPMGHPIVRLRLSPFGTSVQDARAPSHRRGPKNARFGFTFWPLLEKGPDAGFRVLASILQDSTAKVVARVSNYSGTLEFSTLTIFLWPCHILVVKQAD